MEDKIIDEQIIEDILSSITVKEWNTKREKVKQIRNQQWISTNLDMSGLIIQSQIQ